MKRRYSSSRGGLQTVASESGLTTYSTPSSQDLLCVDMGESTGLRPVMLKRGETIADAFRRIQKECSFTGRPYVICLE